MTDSDLEKQARGESQYSLQQLDPSPVEETPAAEKGDVDYFANQPSGPNQTSTLGLAHGPSFYRMKWLF
jgi:hypothetical protein